MADVIGSLKTGGSGDILSLIQLIGKEKFLKDMDAVNLRVMEHERIAKKAYTYASVAGVAMFTAAALASAKFEKEMALVNTLLDDSDKNFGSLKQGILDFATKSSASISSMTRTVYDLISSGVESSKAIGAMSKAVDAAAGGFTSVDVAARAGMANINAYGISIDRLGEVFDYQFASVKYGVFTYEELANSMGNVLPAAATLNISMDELYGAIAEVTKAGIDAQSATTYLSRAFNNISQDSKKWEAMGISVYDAGGKFRGLIPIIGDLSKKMHDMSDRQKTDLLAGLGMDDRAAKAIKVLANNYDQFADTVDKVGDSYGEYKKAADKANDTLIHHAGILKNQVQVGLIEVGDALIPVIRGFAEFFGKSPEAMSSAITGIVALTGSIAVMTGTFKLANTVAKLFGRTMDTLTAARFGSILAIVITATALLAKHYRDVAEEERKKISNDYEEKEALGQLVTRYNELTDKQKLNKRQQAELKELGPKIQAMFASMGMQIDVTKLSTKELTKAFEELKKKSKEGLEAQLAAVNAQIAQMSNKMRDMPAWQQALQPAIKYFQIMYGIGEANVGVVQDLIEKRDLLKDELKQYAGVVENAAKNTGTLTENEEEAGTAAEKHAEALKKLNEQIQTEAEVKEQIGLWKEMYDAHMGDFTAMSQVVAKLTELNRKLKEQDPDVKKMTETWLKEEIAMKVIPGILAQIGLGMGIVKGETDGLKDSTEDNTEAQKKEKEAFLQTIGSLQNLTQNIGGTVGQMGGFLEIVGALVTSANPLQFALSAVSTVLGILGGASDEVVAVWDEWVIANQELVDSLEETMTAVDDISEVSSDRISEIVEEIEDLEGILQEIPKNKGTEETIKRITARITELSAELAGLVEAFQAVTKYNQALEELDFLGASLIETWRKFGASQAINYAGMIELLQESIAEAEAQLALLDPQSAAYAELSAQIERAKMQLELYNLEQLKAAKLAELQTISIEEDAEAYAALEAEIAGIDSRIGEISTSLADENEALRDNIDLINELTQAYGEAQGNLDDLLDYIDYYGTALGDQVVPALEEAIQAAKEELALLDPESQAYRDLAASIAEAEKEYQAYMLLLRIHEMEAELKTLEEGSKEYEILADAIDKCRSRYKALTAAEEDTTDANDDVADSNDDVADSYDEVTDSIEAQMDAMLDWLRMMRDRARAMGLDTTMLDRAIENWDDLTDAYIHNTEVQEDLDAAGIETRAGIMANIEALRALLPEVEQGGFEYQQITDKIAGLAAELGYATDAAGNFIGYLRRIYHEGTAASKGTTALSDELKSASIQTAQALTEQAEKFMALRQQLAEGSMEYGQLTKNIYNVRTQLIEARVAAGDFQAQWEEMHSRVFAKASQFDRDAQAVADAMQKLTYYGVDLGTTNVDEQAGQAIRRMMDFQKTLNPNSQAYADMGAKIDELKTQYEALGGIIPDVADAVAEMETPFSYSTEGSPGSAGYWEDAVESFGDFADRIATEFSEGGSIWDSVTDWGGLLEDLLAMDIDLDTTTADESLAAFIASLETMLGTMDPDSPEYLEALRGLTLLAQMYAQLTGDTTALRNATRSWLTYFRTMVDEYNDFVERHGGNFPTIPDYAFGGGGTRGGGPTGGTHQTGGLLGTEEMPFLGQAGEFVLAKPVVRAFGEDAIARLNYSLDPSLLKDKRGSQEKTRIKIQINEPGPRTWAQVGDRVYGRLNTRRRGFETEASPL